MFSILFALCTLPLGSPAEPAAPEDTIHYSVSMESSAAWGDSRTPLWLNANKYGLSSLQQYNGLVRAQVSQNLTADSDKKWDIAWGVDVAGAAHFTSSFLVQQAYLKVRWLNGTLTVGSKEEPLQLKPDNLSSGSQTLGINARPIPQVRLALDDYLNIFRNHHWLAFKGHLAYGFLTDGDWQKSWTQQQGRYSSDVLYHSKAGYLRFGNPEKPFTFEAGLEMACQFGGQGFKGDEILREKRNLQGFFNTLLWGGKGAEDVLATGGYGNTLGSWVARANLNYPDWYLGLYFDHFFEDHSGMFLLDYDGYGEGDEWNVKKYNKWVHYKLKDMMLGAELQLKNVPWLNHIVVEYLYTKYQSGDQYHDHTPEDPSHRAGMDDYYNHGFYTGWHHWGQVIGNPLYASPIYNKDHQLMVKNNRFVAWHLGVSGQIMPQLSYRLLLSAQKDGLGTYHVPLEVPVGNCSLMTELNYTHRAWLVSLRYGQDNGELLGHNRGMQLSVRFTR